MMIEIVLCITKNIKNYNFKIVEIDYPVIGTYRQFSTKVALRLSAFA